MDKNKKQAAPKDPSGYMGASSDHESGQEGDYERDDIKTKQLPQEIAIAMRGQNSKKASNKANSHKTGRQIITPMSQNNKEEEEEAARSERIQKLRKDNKISSAANIRNQTGRITDPEDEEVVSYQNDQAEDVFDDYGHSEDSGAEESKGQARDGANAAARYSKKTTSSLILQPDKTKNPRSEFSGKKHRPYADSITVG